MAFQIQFRRDSASNWTTIDPLLAQGELGYETDTKKYKIGDGVNTWINLPYQSTAMTFDTLLSNVKMNGIASLGSSGKILNSDHVHPVDISREPVIVPGTLSQYFRGDKTFQTLDKNAVGLNNVTNDTQLKKSAGDYNSFGSGTPDLNDVLLVEDANNSFVKIKLKISDILNLVTEVNSQSVVSDSLSTTTATNFITKATLNTTGIVSGVYAIFGTFNWFYTNINRDFNARIMVDNTTNIWNMNEPPKANSNLKRYACSGFGITYLSSGVHTVTLDWCSSNNIDTAGILNTRLLLVKIG